MDTWLKVNGVPQGYVADDGLDTYKRNSLYGWLSNAFNVFGPYRRPVHDVRGHGAQLVQRQLRPFNPNMVVPQKWSPVAITGNGAELHGTLPQIGLIDVTSGNSNQNQNRAV